MTAIVLAAHGSADGSTETIVRRLAARIERRTGVSVSVAFHLGEPGFDRILDQLDVDRVVVIPLFTSSGYFVESVLPASLRRNHRWGTVDLTITEPVGVSPEVAPAVLQRLRRLAGRHGLSTFRTRVVVVGHGTRRLAGSRAATETLAAGIRATGRFGRVETGFLDDDPTVEDVIRQSGPFDTVVVPFLIGGGDHALTDLPNRLGVTTPNGGSPSRRTVLNGRGLLLDRPFGSYPEVERIIVALATRAGAIATPVGTVYLVGAGPGDPGLLTRRGAALLRRADVVVHDRLVGSAILRLARSSTERIDLGKRPGHAAEIQATINAVLIDRAQRGKSVVRLKGGDPFVFGRGYEELEACREAGVPCEVVPGVSSAIAAPAAAGIPLTSRGVSSSVAIVSGRGVDGEGFSATQAAALAELDTVVVLMSRSSLPLVLQALIAAGRDPETPAACIQSGTLPDQRVCRATLGTLEAAVKVAGLRAPIVTVIGQVASLGGVAAAVDELVDARPVPC